MNIEHAAGLSDAVQTADQPGFARRVWLAAWNLAQTGILLYGLFVTGYLLARLLIGERWNMVAFANNFVPWWALGGLIAGGIALFSRWRWLLAALQVPGVIVFVILYGGLLWPEGSKATSGDGVPLTVATYNMLSGVSDPARVLNVITALDTDVIGLQELGPVHSDLIEAALADEYPYRALYPRVSVYGVGLLSRYPVLEKNIFLPLPDSMPHLRAVLNVGGVPVTIYVVHPSPPGAAFSPLTYSDDKRNAEITSLRETYLTGENGPLLVLGDFNMSDQSDIYRSIDHLLNDAFCEAGYGMGFTFPAWSGASGMIPPLLRIDYVWYSDHFAAVNAYPGHDSGTSDHLPVIAELVLIEETANQ
ncbi:MAG: endonuclease/exonuclease/phosphatase family protein [Anaerolineae bacterium]|nr:endonuclease/exonuclease/phosphatase family protein [Anaerolineae bacterium]